MCENCQEIINDLPQSVRENAQVHAAFLLDGLKKSSLILTEHDEQDQAIIVGAYLIGFLVGNTRNADEPDKLSLQLSINTALTNGDRIGTAFRCCKRSRH